MTDSSTNTTNRTLYIILILVVLPMICCFLLCCAWFTAISSVPFLMLSDEPLDIDTKPLSNREYNGLTERIVDQQTQTGGVVLTGEEFTQLILGSETEGILLEIDANEDDQVEIKASFGGESPNPQYFNIQMTGSMEIRYGRFEKLRMHSLKIGNYTIPIFGMWQDQSSRLNAELRSYNNREFRELVETIDYFKVEDGEFQIVFSDEGFEYFKFDEQKTEDRYFEDLFTQPVPVKR
jgi:hypothetical protein